MLPPLGTLPKPAGKFSQMFLGTGGGGESQFLDVSHLEEL